ncbi:MAG TPA: glycosyltransferase family 9 protein [Thermomicrobiales bacterium]|nr:glycosyltransferase family 9 protein [Thermomicrobiales bacterium]
MQSYGGRIPDVRRIAVLRANAIGDFLFTLPALDALRAAYPDAEIVLLGQRWHEAFLAGRPGPVDRVIAIPRCRGVGEPEDFVNDTDALDQFFARMVEERFDLAIQLHGGGRYSNPFVHRLQSRFTVGLKSAEAAPLDRWMPYVYFQHEIPRYLEVVAMVGAGMVTLEPRVTLTDGDIREAAIVVPLDDAPLVVLHPGAGDPRRRWPPEKFAAVGDALAAAGARVAVVGAREDERQVVEAVVDTMRASAENLWEKLSLGGLAGLLDRCAVVVSNDSGPLHLAAAVDTPTVGIYWCFNLVNAGSLSRTLHRPQLSWRLECPVCGINCLADHCDHDASFVADLPVEQVIASALELLSGQAQSSDGVNAVP